MKSSPFPSFYEQQSEAQREAVVCPKPPRNGEAKDGLSPETRGAGLRFAGSGGLGDPLGNVSKPNPVCPSPSPGLSSPRGEGMLHPRPGPLIHPDPSQVWGLWQGVLLPSACPLRRISVASVVWIICRYPPTQHRPRASPPGVSPGGLRNPTCNTEIYRHTPTRDEKSCFSPRVLPLGLWPDPLGAAAREALKGIELYSLSSLAPGFGRPRTAEAWAGACLPRACTWRNAPPFHPFPASTGLAGPWRPQ